MTKVKTNNNFLCQTSKLNLFTNFSKSQSHLQNTQKIRIPILFPTCV